VGNDSGILNSCGGNLLEETRHAHRDAAERAFSTEVERTTRQGRDNNLDWLVELWGEDAPIAIFDRPSDPDPPLAGLRGRCVGSAILRPNAALRRTLLNRAHTASISAPDAPSASVKAPNSRGSCRTSFSGAERRLGKMQSVKIRSCMRTVGKSAAPLATPEPDVLALLRAAG
jgi:hypothetical protein